MQAKTPEPAQALASNKPRLPTKPKIGRPSIFTDELARSICEELEAGTTLLELCRRPDMPAVCTVYRWKDENPVFREDVTRARHNQMHTWADECVSISDDGTTDYIVKKGRNGVEYEAVDQEHIQRSRLRVDTRLRLMATVAPHLYGEQVSVQHSGAVTVQHELSTRERMRRMALFLLEDRGAGALIEGEASPPAPEAGNQQATPSAQPPKPK